LRSRLIRRALQSESQGCSGLSDPCHRPAAHHHGAAGYRCRRHDPAHRSQRSGGDYGRRAG